MRPESSSQSSAISTGTTRRIWGRGGHWRSRCVRLSPTILASITPNTRRKLLIVVLLRAIDVKVLCCTYCNVVHFPLDLCLKEQPCENILCGCKWLVLAVRTCRALDVSKLVGQCALGQS